MAQTPDTTKNIVIKISVDGGTKEVTSLKDSLQDIGKSIPKINTELSSLFGSLDEFLKSLSTQTDSITKQVIELAKKASGNADTKTSTTDSKKDTKADATDQKKDAKTETKDENKEKKSSLVTKPTDNSKTNQKKEPTQSNLLNVDDGAYEKMQKNEREKSIPVYEEQIKALEKNITTKYDIDSKFTEDSKKLYTTYYDTLAKLYEGDTKTEKEIGEKKTAYLKEYNDRQTAIQKTFAKSKEDSDNKILATLFDTLKNKEDLLEDSLNSEQINALASLKKQEDTLKDRNTLIAEYDKVAVERNEKSTFLLGIFNLNNSINLKESNKNYDESITLRKKNIESLKEEAKEIEANYDIVANIYKKGSEGQIEAIKQKELALAKNRKEISDQQTAIDKAEEEKQKTRQTYYDEAAQNITDFYSKWSGTLTQTSAALTGLLDMGLSDLNDQKKEVEETIETINTKQKEHANNAKSLNEELKTSSGGRAIAIQEQYERESKAAEELLQQKKDAEKDKEKIQKDIDRKEKQKNKIEKVQSMAKAVAEQSAAIVKAWGAGPVLGPIMASLTAAATGVQLAKMAQEWSKLEEGGLLRGKLHSQGGMRIEGTNIEVEGEEFVVNRVSTQKNLGLISYINKQKRELTPDDITSYFGKGRAYPQAQIETKRMYESGGQLTNLDVIDSSTVTDTSKILDAIAKINFKPVVSVVDIATAQNNVTSIKEIAGA